MTTINTSTPSTTLVSVGLMLQTFIRDICDPEQVASIDWWHAANLDTDINIYGEDGYITVCAYGLDEQGQQTGEFTNLAHFHISSVGLTPEERWL